jgi:hypothetical protein
MYRPFFNTASFYPPNSFLNVPMADQTAAQPAIEQSLRNMAKAGVIVDEPAEAAPHKAA